MKQAKRRKYGEGNGRGDSQKPPNMIMRMTRIGPRALAVATSGAAAATIIPSPIAHIPVNTINTYQTQQHKSNEMRCHHNVETKWDGKSQLQQQHQQQHIKMIAQYKEMDI